MFQAPHDFHPTFPLPTSNAMIVRYHTVSINDAVPLHLVANDIAAQALGSKAPHPPMNMYLQLFKDMANYWLNKKLSFILTHNNLTCQPNPPS